jgi:hypothetical protein
VALSHLIFPHGLRREAGFGTWPLAMRIRISEPVAVASSGLSLCHSR